MKHFLFFYVFLSLISSFAFADSKCTSPTNYADLIACAEAQSPEVQNSRLEVERSKALVEAAGQWANPELSAESYHGDVGGQRQSETDISLGVPIELGGKISSRKNVARGELSLAEAKLYEVRAHIRSQILLKLHRFRQVLHEEEIADEAIGTFGKLISQYSKRPGLAPEQQVSLSVYQLSKSDYELKKSGILEEIQSLESFFKFNLGIEALEVRKVLPSSPKSWPKIEASQDSKISPKQQVLQAELETAKAQLSLAQSESWPTLTVGPSMKMQKENRQSDNLMGFNVSLPLPLFSLNGGARAAALAGVKVHESRREFGLREQTLRRDELSKTYAQSVQSLEQSLSHETIEKRHRDAERLFTKGVVPSSLVIESHRTSYDLEKIRHERELRALEALLDLYAIDGKILEVSL